MQSTCNQHAIIKVHQHAINMPSAHPKPSWMWPQNHQRPSACNHQSPSACHQRTQSLHGCGHRIIKGHQHAIIKVHQHAISAPKAFMDVATEPHARLEEARRKHIAKEAAARAVAVVALIEHASRRHLMKEAIMMKEAILMKEVILMKEAITIIIKGRFDSRRWLHASQARRTAVTAPLSGRVRRARCRCASRTPVGNEGGSAVLSTCMRRARCRCAIRHTSSNCGRTAYAIRRNQTQSDAIRRNQAHLEQLRPDGVRGFRARELCAWPVVVAAHLWGRRGAPW
jgi:hypothetical protein